MNYTESSGAESYMPAYEPLQQQTQEARKSRFNLTTVSFGAVFVGIVVLGAFAFYGLASAYPQQMKGFLIAIDRFGITQVGANEQDRIRKINRLPITYEEKQVLIKRTVFFGATRDMVVLALGEPDCFQHDGMAASGEPVEGWLYFIDGESKPTLLAFQNNTLVSAGKTSALDGCR